MVLNFEDLAKELNEYTPAKGNIKVTKEYNFYPHEEREHLITTKPSYVTFERLKYLKENGSDVGISLERGLIEIKYGEDKLLCSRLPGIFEGIIDGKKVLGVMVGESVSSDLKDPPKKDEILKIKDYLKILNDMGLVKDFNYFLTI